MRLHILRFYLFEKGRINMDDNKTYNADELLNKLKEIETLVRENVNPDGSSRFDSYHLMMALELAKRIIVIEEKNE